MRIDVVKHAQVVSACQFRDKLKHDEFGKWPESQKFAISTLSYNNINIYCKNRIHETKFSM